MVWSSQVWFVRQQAYLPRIARALLLVYNASVTLGNGWYMCHVAIYSENLCRCVQSWQFHILLAGIAAFHCGIERSFTVTWRLNFESVYDIFLNSWEWRGAGNGCCFEPLFFYFSKIPARSMSGIQSDDDDHGGSCILLSCFDQALLCAMPDGWWHEEALHRSVRSNK